MTCHYFQVGKLEPAQEQRLRAVFKEYPAQQGGEGGTRGVSGGGRRGIVKRDGLRFTPAVVEQVASEHETVDDFIAALEARI